MADIDATATGPRAADATRKQDDDNLVEQAQAALGDLVEDVQNAFGLGDDPAETLDEAAADAGIDHVDGDWGAQVGPDGLDVGGDGAIVLEGKDGREYEIPVGGQVHVDPFDVGPVLPGDGQLTGQIGPEGGVLDGTYDSGTGYTGDLHADEDGLDVTGSTPGGMGTIHADEDGAQGGWVGDDGSTGEVSVDEGGLDASYDPEGEGSGTLHVDEDGAEGTWKTDDGTFTGTVDEDSASGTWETEDNTTTVELDDDGLHADTKGTWGDPMNPEDGYGSYEGQLDVDEDSLTGSGRAEGHWEGEVFGAPVEADGTVEGDLAIDGDSVDFGARGEGTATVYGQELGGIEGSVDGHFGGGAADVGFESEATIATSYGGVPIDHTVDASGNAHVDGDGYAVEGQVGYEMDTPFGQPVDVSVGGSASGDWGDVGGSAEEAWDSAGDAANDAGESGEDFIEDTGESLSDGNPFN
jgi:hypothetical protein